MRIGIIVLLSCAAMGCGDEEPVDIAGDYIASVINGENGCGLESWTEGETSTGVPLTVVQQGTDVTIIVEGLTGVGLDIWLGNNTFVGKIHGDQVDLALTGTNELSAGSCTYRINAFVLAEATSATIGGDITYTPVPTSDTGCEDITECESIQQFTALRSGGEQ